MSALKTELSREFGRHSTKSLADGTFEYIHILRSCKSLTFFIQNTESYGTAIRLFHFNSLSTIDSLSLHWLWMTTHLRFEEDASYHYLYLWKFLCRYDTNQTLKYSQKSVKHWIRRNIKNLTRTDAESANPSVITNSCDTRGSLQ